MLINRLTKTLSSSTRPQDDLLIQALSRFDNKPQVVRTPLNKESYIHSSSLPEFCARRSAILVEENRQPKEYVTGGMKIVWAMGRAVETYVRNAIIAVVGRKKCFRNMGM